MVQHVIMIQSELMMMVLVSVQLIILIVMVMVVDVDCAGECGGSWQMTVVSVVEMVCCLESTVDILY